MPGCAKDPASQIKHFNTLCQYMQKAYMKEGTGTHTDSDMIQKIVEWLPKEESNIYAMQASKACFVVPNDPHLYAEELDTKKRRNIPKCM